MSQVHDGDKPKTKKEKLVLMTASENEKYTPPPTHIYAKNTLSEFIGFLYWPLHNFP